MRGTEREKFESTQQLGMGDGGGRGCVGASCTFLNLESTWAPIWAPGAGEEGGYRSPTFHHTLLCLFHKAGTELRLHGPQRRHPLHTRLLGIPCGPEVGSLWSQVTQRLKAKLGLECGYPGTQPKATALASLWFRHSSPELG